MKGAGGWTRIEKWRWKHGGFQRLYKLIKQNQGGLMMNIGMEQRGVGGTQAPSTPLRQGGRQGGWHGWREGPPCNGKWLVQFEGCWGLSLQKQGGAEPPCDIFSHWVAEVAFPMPCGWTTSTLSTPHSVGSLLLSSLCPWSAAPRDSEKERACLSEHSRTSVLPLHCLCLLAEGQREKSVSATDVLGCPCLPSTGCRVEPCLPAVSWGIPESQE